MKTNKTYVSIILLMFMSLFLYSCDKGRKENSPPYTAHFGMITEYSENSLTILTDEYEKYLITNINDIKGSEKSFVVNDRIVFLGLMNNKRVEKDTVVYDFEIAVFNELEMDVITIGDVVMKNSVNEEDLLDKFGRWSFMSYAYDISDKYYTAKYSWSPKNDDSRHKITFVVDNTKGEPTISETGELVLDVEVYKNMLDGGEGGVNDPWKSSFVSLPIDQYTKIEGLKELIINVKEKNGDESITNSIIWNKMNWEDSMKK